MDDKDVDKILKQLDHERSKYTSANQAKMEELISVLVEEGVYEDTPLTLKCREEGKENPFLTMVECWGVRWHEYREPHFCPHCNEDLRDYEWGPPGKREIGFYSQEVDATLYDLCPACKGMVTDRRFRDDTRIA